LEAFTPLKHELWHPWWLKPSVIYLCEKPGLHLDEMAVFLWDEF
jgi:hypothetical protein